MTPARGGPRSGARCCRSPTRRGIVEFARGLAELGVEIVSTGGTAPRAARARASRSGRSTTSPASRRSWTAASRRCTRSSTRACSRGATTRSTCAAAEEQEHRVRRPRVREPLPVRAHGGPARRRPTHEVIENIDIGGPTMIRAAAKNFAFAAVVVAPESYDAVLAGAARRRRQRCRCGTRESARRRGVRLHRPLRHRDRALVRREAGRLPAAADVRAYEKVLDLAYGENPHQRAAYYAQVGARMHVLSMVAPARAARSCRSTTCSTSTPARLLVDEFERAGVRDHQAQQPVRRAPSAARRSRPTSARSRATRCRRSAASSASTARSTGALAEALAEQFAEVVFAPGLQRRRAGGR